MGKALPVGRKKYRTGEKFCSTGASPFLFRRYKNLNYSLESSRKGGITYRSVTLKGDEGRHSEECPTKEV